MSKIRHWTCIEQIQYFFFLIFKFHELDKRKKSSRIFLEMSRFLGSKGSSQCRTHHIKQTQELLHKTRNQEEKTIVQVKLLRKFYYQYYTIRKLSLEHLRIELMSTLAEKIAEKSFTQQQYQEYQSKMEENLHELFLERNQIRQGSKADLSTCKTKVSSKKDKVYGQICDNINLSEQIEQQSLFPSSINPTFFTLGVDNE